MAQDTDLLAVADALHALAVETAPEGFEAHWAHDGVKLATKDAFNAPDPTAKSSWIALRAWRDEVLTRAIAAFPGRQLYLGNRGKLAYHQVGSFGQVSAVSALVRIRLTEEERQDTLLGVMNGRVSRHLRSKSAGRVS